MSLMPDSNTAALDAYIHAVYGGEHCSLCHKKHYGKTPSDDPEGYCCSALKCPEWFGAACLADAEAVAEAGVFLCAVCGDVRCKCHDIEQAERDAGACWDCMAERAVGLSKELSGVEVDNKALRNALLIVHGELREARGTRATFAIGGWIVGFLVACLLVLVGMTS